MSGEMVWAAHRLSEPDNRYEYRLTVSQAKHLLYDGLSVEAARLVVDAYTKCCLAEAVGGRGSVLVSRNNAGRHMLVSGGRVEVEYVVVATPDDDDLATFLGAALRVDVDSLSGVDAVPAGTVPVQPAIGGRRRWRSGVFSPSRRS